MTRSSARSKRPKDDRLITLREAGPRVGYSPQSLRNMMFLPDHRMRPPLQKLYGRWLVWTSEIDAWAIEYRSRHEREAS